MTCTRRTTGSALAALLAIWSAAVCRADDVPHARAEGKFTAAGAYELNLTCDPAKFLPAQKSEAGGAPQADSEKGPVEKELESRLAEAKDAFAKELKIQFDGKSDTNVQIQFPTADELRQSAQKENSDRLVRIIIRGSVPADAQAFAVEFPTEIGPVDLALRSQTGDRQVQILKPGETSALFLLKEDTEPVKQEEKPQPQFSQRFVVYSVLAVILVVLLGIRTMRRPGI